MLVVVAVFLGIQLGRAGAINPAPVGRERERDPWDSKSKDELTWAGRNTQKLTVELSVFGPQH